MIFSSSIDYTYDNRLYISGEMIYKIHQPSLQNLLYVLFIRCVEPIIYNEHVVSFRQKTLKHSSFAAELINNFVAAV